MRDAVSLSFYGINGGGGGDVPPPGSIVIPPEDQGKLIISYDAYEIVGNNNAPSEITVYYAENDIIPPSAFRSIINQNTVYCYIKICNLPDTIKEISEFAFYSDQRLNLVLPSDLEVIGEQAFRYCANLDIDTIPVKVKTIGARAFANCTKISTLTFLGKPESIESNAFSSDTNLTLIQVPWDVNEVDNAPWGASNATIVYNYQGE